jgi:Flp pilus assembly protein TadG
MGTGKGENMATVARILLGVLAGALAVSAQTAVYDTSILREGNTWTYVRGESTPEFGENTTYEGMMTLRIDSLSIAGDSVTFTVTRDDTGKTTLESAPPGWPLVSYSRTTSATRHVFRGNAFTPSVPLFMEGQAFTDTSPRVVYGGDTLRQAKYQSPEYASCAPTSWENLEGIGRIRYSYAYACGNTHGGSGYTLTSFNSVPYQASQVFPVALTASLARKLPNGAARVLLHRGRVTYERDGRLFDLKGQRLPAKSIPHSTEP